MFRLNPGGLSGIHREVQQQMLSGGAIGAASGAAGALWEDIKKSLP